MDPFTTPDGLDPDRVVGIDGSASDLAGSIAELEKFCWRVEESRTPAVALVYLTGVPDPSWYRTVTISLVNKWERALRRMERLDAAIIAIASGACGGAAFEALLATDYRIADRTLRLQLPAGGQGAWPGMSMYRMANQLGVVPTRRAVMRGTAISAPDALALGLVDQLADDPAGEAGELVRSNPAFAGEGTAVRRQLMLDATTTTFENALGTHLAACDRMLRRAPVEALA
jgi:isomerase DpgB